MVYHDMLYYKWQKNKLIDININIIIIINKLVYKLINTL